MTRAVIQKIAFALLLGALVVAFNGWINSQKRLAYEQGKRESEIASAAQIEEWREKYEAMRTYAVTTYQDRAATYQREVAPIKEGIAREVESRTDRHCLSDDAERLLEEQRQAANRKFTPPARSGLP